MDFDVWFLCVLALAVVWYLGCKWIEAYVAVNTYEEQEVGDGKTTEA